MVLYSRGSIQNHYRSLPLSTHEYTDDEFSESDDDDDDDDVDTVPLWCPLAEREELHLSEQKLITLLSLYWMLRQMYQTKPRHITSDCTNPIDIFLKYLDTEIIDNILYQSN